MKEFFEFDDFSFMRIAKVGGIDVFYAPEFCKKREVLSAGIVQISNKDTNETFPIIVVNDEFLECPFKEQKFILYHEVGHYKSGHFNETFKTKLKRFHLGKGRSIILELEADLYAAKKLGYKDAVFYLGKIDEWNMATYNCHNSEAVYRGLFICIEKLFKIL